MLQYLHNRDQCLVIRSPKGFAPLTCKQVMFNGSRSHFRCTTPTVESVALSVLSHLRAHIVNFVSVLLCYDVNVMAKDTSRPIRWVMYIFHRHYCCRVIVVFGARGHRDIMAGVGADTIFKRSQK